MKYAARLIALAPLLLPSTAQACATCFGDPDSPQVQAANMAIFFMLGVAFFVLTTIASFFVYLITRANRIPASIESREETRR